MFSLGNHSVAATHLHQTRFTGYDALSRDHIRYTEDGHPTKPRIFGSTTLTAYISLLETHVQTVTNEVTPKQLSLNVTYRDGLNRSMLSVSQLEAEWPEQVRAKS